MGRSAHSHDSKVTPGKGAFPIGGICVARGHLGRCDRSNSSEGAGVGGQIQVWEVICRRERSIVGVGGHCRCGRSSPSEGAGVGGQAHQKVQVW